MALHEKTETKKQTKVATFNLDLNRSKEVREDLSVWLHAIAEEIKTIDDAEYVNSPKWNYFI